MTKSHTYTVFGSTAALALVLIACLLPRMTEASNHDYFDAGWYEHRSQILAADTSCGPGMARVSFVLKDYDSMDNLTDTTGLSLNIQVWNENTFMMVRQTGFAPVSSADGRRSICYNPLTERINPTIRATAESQYRSYRGYGWIWMNSGARQREIGYHLQGFIHLMRKSDGPYTTRAVYPARQIVNVSPEYRFVIPAMTNLYGATAVDSTITHVVDMVSGALVRRRDIDTRGGAGTFRLSNVSLADGYYAWTFTNRMNGNNVVRFSNLSLTQRNNTAPSTGWPTPAPFLVDRVAPAARAAHTLGAEAESNVSVEIAATVRDPLAGMATIRYTVEDITPGQTRSSGSYTYPFTVGEGVTGGPKSEQVVTVPFNLLPGSTYRYTVVATDAAGNRTTTAAVTFTTPGTRPDVVEPPVVEPVDIDIDLTVSPGIVRRGDPVTITWTATPAGSITGCTLTGIGAEPVAVNPNAPEGGLSVTVTALQTFTLRCTGSDGSVHEATAIVQMLPEIYET